MPKIKLNQSNKEWNDVPTITEEGLREFQANCVAYTVANQGECVAPRENSHLAVLLMSLLQEIREIKDLLKQKTGEEVSKVSLFEDAKKEVPGGGDPNKKGPVQNIQKS